MRLRFVSAKCSYVSRSAFQFSRHTWANQRKTQIETKFLLINKIYTMKM